MFNGFSIAAALSHQGIDVTSGKVFEYPSSQPPSLDETLPTDLIRWPEKKDGRKNRL